jgi:hypothetical protein
VVRVRTAHALTPLGASRFARMLPSGDWLRISDTVVLRGACKWLGLDALYIKALALVSPTQRRSQPQGGASAP